MPVDNIKNLIADLNGDVPAPSASLTENDKDLIVAALGPKTVQSILKTKASLPLSRIPFLFSSLNTQMVVDVISHDFTAALARAGVLLTGGTRRR